MNEREATGEPKGTGEETKLARAWDQFYAYCHAIINECPGVRKLSGADREDCIQEVMMEIVRKLGEARPEDAPGYLESWIRVVSRNRAADILRRRYRKPEVMFDDGAGGAVLDDEAKAGGESELNAGDYVSIVWEALLALDQEVSATSYLAFYMRTIEGWDVQQVADLFDITPDQVRARCSRVKTKFGTVLKTKNRKPRKPGSA